MRRGLEEIVDRHSGLALFGMINFVVLCLLDWRSFNHEGFGFVAALLVWNLLRAVLSTAILAVFYPQLWNRMASRNRK